MELPSKKAHSGSYSDEKAEEDAIKGRIARRESLHLSLAIFKEFVAYSNFNDAYYKPYRMLFKEKYRVDEKGATVPILASSVPKSSAPI
jgi:hypothetical protein